MTRGRNVVVETVRPITSGTIISDFIECIGMGISTLEAVPPRWH